MTAGAMKTQWMPHWRSRIGMGFPPDASQMLAKMVRSALPQSRWSAAYSKAKMRRAPQADLLTEAGRREAAAAVVARTERRDAAQQIRRRVLATQLGEDGRRQLARRLRAKPCKKIVDI